MAFRLAIETNGSGGVERIVFLVLRGEEGNAECAWPIPLDRPAELDKPGVQLRLIADDGYEGPSSPRARAGNGVKLDPPRPRRRHAG